MSSFSRLLRGKTQVYYRSDVLGIDHIMKLENVAVNCTYIAVEWDRLRWSCVHNIISCALRVNAK